MRSPWLRGLRWSWLRLHAAVAFALYWTWRGWRASWRNRRSQLGAAWLMTLGVALGFLGGAGSVYFFGRFETVRHYVYGENGALPRPVTAPPPGTAWAQALTTGYCPCAICCAGSADNKTAVNRDVRQHPHGIASDPRLVPAWTVLDVPGYGHAVVDDTGGAMRQSGAGGIVHLDLRFPDHQQARRWGRRWLWIAVPAGSPAARLRPPQRGP